MRFESEFEVPGKPADVIEKFADVPLMASFLPGASVDEVRPDGSYPGTLTVSFGPKKLAFKGTVSNQVDQANFSGLVTGQGNADVRGAKIAVKMNYSLTAAGTTSQPVTQVRLISEAQLSGLLAEFARTGGVALTNAILSEFTRRFSAQFGTTSSACTSVSAEAPAEALSALSLARAITGSMFRRVLEALRLK